MVSVYCRTLHNDAHNGAQQGYSGDMGKRATDTATDGHNGAGMTAESVKPITDYLAALPEHELLQLFEALDTGVDALEFNDCNEEKLVKDFLLTMWRVTRWRMIAKEDA